MGRAASRGTIAVDAQGPTQCAVIYEPFPLAQRISAYVAEPEWRRVAEALCLTGRELDIVRLLLDECDEDNVGETLGISRATVHTHLQRLYIRLRIHRRCDLVTRVFAVILSFRPPPDAPV